MTHATSTTALPVKLIRVDALQWEGLDCQRAPNLARAGKMAADFNKTKANVLSVAAVPNDDGTSTTYFVMDGWHRREAARIAGEEFILCYVHHGLDKEARAEMFLELNNDVKPGKLDHHRIAVSAGRADALTIDRVLATYGLKIGRSPSKNTVAAIAGCYTALGKYGEDNFGAAIAALHEAWSGAFGGDAWKGEFIVGLARFFSMNPAAKHSRTVAALKAKSPSWYMGQIVDRSAGSGGSGGRPIHMAKIVKERYNTKLRSGRLS